MTPVLAMMTSSNGNIFRVSGPLCGSSPATGEFPAQRPVTRSFDVFFDLCINKRLSKQSWGWWFETLSWSLWRHCNAMPPSDISLTWAVSRETRLGLRAVSRAGVATMEGALAGPLPSTCPTRSASHTARGPLGPLGPNAIHWNKENARLSPWENESPTSKDSTGWGFPASSNSHFNDFKVHIRCVIWFIWKC